MSPKDANITKKLASKEYTNRSELPLIDRLVWSIYASFERFSALLKKSESDSSICLENCDKVGFMISPPETDLATRMNDKTPLPEVQKFDELESQNAGIVNSMRPSDKIVSLPVPVTNSMQMTRSMSQSKVKIHQTLHILYPIL